MALPGRNHRLIGIASLLTVLVILQVTVGIAKRVHPEASYLFTPMDVTRAATATTVADLARATIVTFVRAICGFSFAAALGIVGGILTGRNPWIHAVARPFIDLLRPLPSSALAPIAVMIIGFREASYQSIIVYGAFWPVLLSTYDGTSRVNRTARDTMQQLELTRWQRLRLFVLPEAAAEIMTGMKIALSISLILAVTAELLIGKNSGLGSFIKDMSGAGRVPESYLGVVVVALLGLCMNGMFRVVEAQLPWLVNRDEARVGYTHQQ